MKQQNGGKQMKDVWRFTSAKKNEKVEGKHPTQKPIQLLDYVLQSSTNKGDLVLDPFSGSGTTGVASIINQRKFIGIEKEKKYCELSVRRFKKNLAKNLFSYND